MYQSSAIRSSIASRTRAKDRKLSPSVRAQIRLMFDAPYYADRYELADSIGAFDHFLQTGLYEGFNPSPVFDSAWYAARYLTESGTATLPIIDFLEAGHKEGRSPHPLFDLHWYAKHNALATAAGHNLLLHFLSTEPADLKNPHPLFDASWYLRQYGDVADAGVNPLVHFLKFGAAELRQPSPLFDTERYVQANPSLGLSGENPLVHFLEQGRLSAGDATEHFDTFWYLRQYPDVVEAKIHPLVHYLQHGAEEGRDPSSRFSTNWYKEQNPDVVAAGVNPLVHYAAVGSKEGRSPHPWAVSVRINELERERRHLNGKPLGGLDSFVDRTGSEDLEPPRQTSSLSLPDDEAKILSFDVWSTLLHRECHPDEIKLQSARFLLLKNWSRLKPAYQDLNVLYEARLRSENASAPNNEHEYRFCDAMLLWIDEVSEAGLSVSERADIYESLLKHEMQAEVRSTYTDPATTALARNSKSTKVFLSDFYMNGLFMDDLLRRHEIRSLFAKGYVSSDTYETKRSGRLFKRLLAEFQVEPHEVVHIGDNHLADQDVPQQLGLRILPYNAPDEEKRLEWYAQAFWALREGKKEPHERRIMALLDQLANNLPATEDREIRAAGIRMAPLVFSYCLSIMECATSFGDEKVFFFTREGHFAKAIYDAIRSEDPYNIETPPSELLEVSRKATFAASLDNFNAAELERIWSLYSKQSARALCVSLNLSEEIGTSAADRAGLPFDEAIQSPGSDERFLRFMTDPTFRAHANDRIAEQKEMLLAYLADHGIEPGSSSGLCVADIGWRGTIQDNLSHLLKRPIRGHYLALFKYLNQQPVQSSKVGWLSDENHHQPYRIRDQVAPLEMIFNGPGGSVIGYERKEAGGTRAVTQIIPGEEAIVEELSPFREGEIQAARLLSRYARLHGLMASDFLRLSRQIVEAFIDTPPKALADAFGRLEHNESFGVGGTDHVNLGVGDPFSSQAVGAALHAELTAFLKDTRWKEAAVRERRAEAWWEDASDAQKASVPIAFTRAHSPALIKNIGSRLAIYAPAPLRASGGHRTIFNMVRRLGDVGFSPHIYLEHPGAGVEVVEEYLQGLRATVDLSWKSNRSSDVAIATIAHSASYVADEIDAHLKGYLVQDFEALFNPVGDAYVVGENSFTKQLHHFTVGNWLTHVVHNQYGGSAAGSGLGIDTAVYRRLDGVKRRKAVCMLVQPDKPRRGNNLGLSALRLLKSAMPDVEIVLFGSDEKIILDFETTQLGLISDLNTLNDLYNCCIAGVCLSLSNPSRIPFEMMAAGCVPVDLYRYNNLMDYDLGTAVLAYQSADSIAHALVQILLEAEVESRAVALANYGASRTLDWEMDGLVNNLSLLLDGRSRLSSKVEATYIAPPTIAPEDTTDGVAAFCAWQAHLAGLHGESA
jgi:O-antigen biosynthesis protein